MISEADKDYLTNYLGLPDPIAAPRSKLGWKCPECGYIWAPTVEECKDCNTERCDCMDKVQRLEGLLGLQSVPDTKTAEKKEKSN